MFASVITKVTRTSTYDELPEWLSVAETAAYCGCTTYRIYQHVHQGVIPYRRMGPKVIMIPKSYFHANRAQAQVTQVTA